MWMDNDLEFGDALSVATEAGTSLIGDVIDLGVARDIGQSSRQLYLVIQVVTAFDGGATAGGTTQFVLMSDSVAAIPADGNESRHWTSDVFAAATQLTAGKQMVVPLPMGDTGPGTGYERYLGLGVVQASEGEDDGTVNAFLTFDPVGFHNYPDASN